MGFSKSEKGHGVKSSRGNMLLHDIEKAEPDLDVRDPETGLTGRELQFIYAQLVLGYNIKKSAEYAGVMKNPNRWASHVKNKPAFTNYINNIKFSYFGDTKEKIAVSLSRIENLVEGDWGIYASDIKELMANLKNIALTHDKPGIVINATKVFLDFAKADMQMRKDANTELLGALTSWTTVEDLKGRDITDEKLLKAKDQLEKESTIERKLEDFEDGETDEEVEIS